MTDWRARPVATGAGLRVRFAGLSAARRGALIFICASLVFSATDAITKTLVSGVPVVDVVFGRHISYLVAVIVLAGRRGPRRLLVTRRRWTQLARGLAMFGATFSFFLALSLLPLAEVSTLASSTPLIILCLAGPLLGERVAKVTVVGALIGFSGVIVLVGIDPAKLNLATLVPLGTAVSYALFSLLTRALRSEAPETTVFYSGVVGMVAATVLFILGPRGSMPEPIQWFGIGVIGLTALTGHRLLVAAYRWGRASDLAPLSYLSLIWAFAIGATIFGEPILPTALIGAAAIAIGGIVALRTGPTDEMDTPASVDYGDPLDADDRIDRRPADA